MITYRTMDVDGLWNKIDSRGVDIDTLILRFYLRHITKRFSSDHVEIIIGPRQSGKTTLLIMLMHELAKSGIDPQQIYYINLDTLGEMEQFKNPLLFVKQIDDSRRGEERVYVFIDEVQRLANPGKFLKGVYDLAKNIKLFVSGSSSLEIRSKIKEFLTGRKRETYLLPLSFKEYVNYGNKIPGGLDAVKFSGLSTDHWKQNETLYGAYLMKILEEIAVYGGYPAVLTAKNHRERIQELHEIYQSYVRKDVIDFLKVEKTGVFNHLVKVLAAQVGNLINKSEICSLLGSNAITVAKYMTLLEETYITGYLPPFVSSKRSEVKSAHKCFFIDNGLRNFAVRQFNALGTRVDKGALVENIIFAELVKGNALLNEELFFWRSKSGAEVDFVLLDGNKMIPIEIKSGPARPGLLSRSFHAFLDRFSPGIAFFLNRDLFHIETIKQTRVYYLPVHWFLLFGVNLVLE
jgi:predicted AAA+ superfamily ATPase